MKTITRNEAGFSELFEFAGEKYQKEWNVCCDLFHRSEFLNYNKPTEFNLAELEADLEDDGPYGLGKDPNSDMFVAATITVAFMHKHKVDDITITGV